MGDSMQFRIRFKTKLFWIIKPWETVYVVLFSQQSDQINQSSIEKFPANIKKIFRTKIIQELYCDKKMFKKIVRLWWKILPHASYLSDISPIPFIAFATFLIKKILKYGQISKGKITRSLFTSRILSIKVKCN